jgi:hypothetical protein
VTCDEIEAWRPVQPNRWVQEEWRYSTLRERMYALVEGCEAAIALPGGLGTLAEIMVMWTHLLTGAIKPRPLVLVEQGWKEVIEQLYRSQGDFIPLPQREYVSLTENVEAAARQVLRTES